MNKKLVLLSMLFGALASGCATPVEPSYDSKASYALNVWRASGMDGIMKDTTVPTSKVGGTFDSGTGRLLGVYSDTKLATFGGLDPSIALGAGLLVSLFEPDKPPFRDSFFYWEEYKNGESELDTRKRVLESLKEPVKDAMSALGYEVLHTHIFESKNFVVGSYLFLTINFYGKHKECEKYVYKTSVDEAIVSTCNLSISLPEIKDKPKYGPNILELNTKKYWYQSPRDITRGEIEIRYSKEGSKKTEKEKDLFMSGFNSHEILTKISEKMPKNYFLYLAPKNKTYANDGKKIEIPLVLEQGKTYSFVIEEKAEQ
jgi:hypothetical protein